MKTFIIKDRHSKAQTEVQAETAFNAVNKHAQSKKPSWAKGVRIQGKGNSFEVRYSGNGAIGKDLYQVIEP